MSAVLAHRWRMHPCSPATYVPSCQLMRFCGVVLDVAMRRCLMW
jgi:hypothetical protein